MPFDAEPSTPTLASLTAVRAFNRRNLELYAYLHSPAGLKQRAAMRLGPAPVIRSATEDEVIQIAAELDAGGVIVPRLWIETFKVSA